MALDYQYTSTIENSVKPVFRRLPVARKGKRGEYKQGPPIQFRPGPELERPILSFASAHGLHPNEACKALVALAINDMDVRFYGLVRQLAEVLGSANAFARACDHVHSALVGARCATGEPIQFDPERCLIILKIIRDYLGAQGLQVQEQGLWFLPAPRPEPQADRREAFHDQFKRTKRRVLPLKKRQQPAEEPQEEAEQEPQASRPEPPPLLPT
jgi:hypothetical protein